MKKTRNKIRRSSLIWLAVPDAQSIVTELWSLAVILVNGTLYHTRSMSTELRPEGSELRSDRADLRAERADY